MAIQTINLGTAPSGAGGDTFRSTGTKVNENFTNNTHAASRLVGTAAGNLMEVGAFGLGGGQGLYGGNNLNDTKFHLNACWFTTTAETNGWANGIFQTWRGNATRYAQLGFTDSGGINFRSGLNISSAGAWVGFRTTANTTVDSNGFIKSASPVVQLFAEKIQPNDEALEQEPIFEKVDVGHYLLKNTEGFSDDGWYIEMPKDANGNVLVAVQYQQFEDNTIAVKTFAKKFDEETGDILPNLEKPRDIPAGRWIDIRLKELPKPEIEISNTPPEFQPTNLAQAVAEALKDDSEQ
ncbi:hypothetical protein KTI63_02350 [Acinetobacter guillouiae]|uniref:phage tail fiber protein n=1 Tax=Acinetobacter guillouiae TaxID=106649 RepID=UPI0021D2ACB6|nr:hypothetical protein [Acinetobacter guillouiae]MCU4491307.1 hypothetical protein [Acinetobacter guillouiae]